MYLERVISSSTLRTFQLAFFGGEPLLYYKKIVHLLIKKCSELCNKYNKKFQVNFTTNGICLTPNVVDDLIKLSNWVSIQVAKEKEK
jgi:putative transcriptional regulator